MPERGLWPYRLHTGQIETHAYIGRKLRSVRAQTQTQIGVFEVLLQQLGQICRAHLVLRDDDDANMGPRVDVPTR